MKILCFSFSLFYTSKFQCRRKNILVWLDSIKKPTINNNKKNPSNTEFSHDPTEVQVVSKVYFEGCVKILEQW